MRRLSVPEFKESDKMPLVVVLDNVRSLYNVGSVFRTCDAFRVSELLLCGITACPPSVEIHKTALGAENSVEWRFFKQTENAIDYLKDIGYSIFSVEQCRGSISLENVSDSVRKGRCALVFGHEVKGVQQHIVDMSDGCVEIPQFGTKHSLNVAVAVGMVVWECFKAIQLPLAGKFFL